MCKIVFVGRRVACRDARSAAAQRLARLGQDIKQYILQLTAIAHFSLITLALTMHVDEGIRRGWNIPDISLFVKREPGAVKFHRM